MLFDKKIRGAGKWSSSRWNKSNQSKRKKERIITTTACWPPGCVSVEFSVGKVERVRDLKWVKFDCSSITRLGPYSFIDIDVCRLVKRERERVKERERKRHGNRQSWADVWSSLKRQQKPAAFHRSLVPLLTMKTWFHEPDWAIGIASIDA